MTGLRQETRGTGAFAFSLLVHGAVIAGFAAFAAPRPGLPQPDIVPVALVMLPAPAEAPTPVAPAVAEPPVQEPEPAPPEPMPVEAPPEPPPLPQMAELPPPPPPPPPLPEALPLPEPPPPPVAVIEPPPPEPMKPEVKPAPKPVPKPRPVVAKAPAKPAAPSPVALAAADPGPVAAAPAAPPAPPAPPPPAPVPEIAAGPPLITEPRFREPPSKPVYPSRAAAMDQQGEALVRVLVTPEGDQQEVQIWRSSGFDLLDRAALAAVRRWRFEPYRRNGIAQAAWVQVPVRFSLN